LGEPKLNVNTASENQMIEAGLDTYLADAITNFRNNQGTFSTWAELLQVPGVTLQNVGTILDALTLETNDSSLGKININTASEQVLNLMPGMSPDVASAIVARQGTFLGLGDLAGVPGISLALLGQVAGMVTISSEAFIVRVIGSYGSARYALRAIVTIEETGPVLKKVERYPFVDAALRWGWASEAETQLALVDRN
jgi:DNA uptake protein ComE-like DNA-binding protein